MLIVDAHLDLAYNALNGREVTKPAAEQSPQFGDGTPSVGLPDLRRGGVSLICGTIFCEPARGDSPGYKTAEQARGQAQRQLRWYYKQVTDGVLEIVTAPEQLATAAGERVKTILLMEGADPLRTP